MIMVYILNYNYIIFLNNNLCMVFLLEFYLFLLLLFFEFLYLGKCLFICISFIGNEV